MIQASQLGTCLSWKDAILGKVWCPRDSIVCTLRSRAYLCPPSNLYRESTHFGC